MSLVDPGSARKPTSPFGRYLLYAIGEIALVVIGILIALQINTWNSNEIERQEETSYLTRISSDLTLDSEIVDYILENMEIKKARIAQSRRVIKRNLLMPRDSLFLLLERSAVMGTDLREDRRKATYNEMISSGHLRYIQNTRLRESLSNYYTMWDHWYDRIENHRSDFRMLVFKLGDLTHVLPRGQKMEDLTPVNLNDLLTEKELNTLFEKELTHELNYTSFVIWKISQLKELLEDIRVQVKLKLEE